MFRQKFWVSLVLSIPVLLYSMGLQMMLGISMPAFPGSQWLAPVFAVIVFAVAAAEVAVGLALIISVSRRQKTVIADDINLLKW